MGVAARTSPKPDKSYSRFQRQGGSATVWPAYDFKLEDFLFLTPHPRLHFPYNPIAASLPTVLFDEVMSKDEYLLEWLEKIVSSLKISVCMDVATTNRHEALDGILHDQGRSTQPRIDQGSHREDRVYQTHPLWYMH